MDLYTGKFLVKSVGIGHWQDEEAKTGCTVVMPKKDLATAGMKCCGRAPATRELDLLRIDGVAPGVSAIVLTGGSAFGLSSADGVLRFLEKEKRGFDVGITTVPLVPTFALYDLAVGDAFVRPDRDAGMAACENIVYGDQIQSGQVGAGTGATVNKLSGMDEAWPSGVGLCSAILDGVNLSVLAVSNAFGAIYDRSGNPLGQINSLKPGSAQNAFLHDPGGNCTFAVVCVDAGLSRKQANIMAEMAMAGFCRAIKPAHSKYDFDAVVVISAGEGETSVTAMGSAAAEAVHEALVDCCRTSN